MRDREAVNPRKEHLAGFLDKNALGATSLDD
jgi:hypothetical protein